MPFEQFPYTNFHELNEDWIIKTVKEVKDKAENIDASVTDAQAAADAAAASEENAASYAEEASLAEQNIVDYTSELSEKVDNNTENINANAAAIQVNSARIDTITTLPQGSTSGDAELQDIRVWFNGNTSANAGDAVRGQASLLNDKIELLDDSFNIDTYNTTTTINVTPTFTTGGVDQNGTIYPEYTTFQYTQKIPVEVGDVVTAVNSSNVPQRMRWLCAYNGNTAVPSSGLNDDSTSYIVPDGIDGIIISVRVAGNVTAIKINRNIETEVATLKKIPMGYMSIKQLMGNNDSMSLPYHNVKNDNCYIFNANITSFNAIRFSKGHTLEVNNTNIVITNDSGGLTIPHGLTIAHDISLLIENTDKTYTSLIRLSSNGEEYSYTLPARFLMDENAPTIQTVNSTLTECRLSWISRNINEPIWLFGDSYISWYPERWSYYLARDGFLKCSMFNGFAGQGCLTAIQALRNLLDITVPKIVVWCIGMNDGDTASAINSSWYTTYNELITLSKQKGFELILYTVPTTPTINNEFKNEVIRNSGYRYIEADLSVRIPNSRNWISGALDVDNVHTTAKGAKIIYYRVLADLPEIMSND